MDFHSLSRRELQVLCKKNKIPANITNVAMANALKALEIVEGMDEFMHHSQSETAQSSVESPARLEVTSSRAPPSGVRSTCRRQVGKEEPATVKPINRSQHATRKSLVESQDYAIGAKALTTLQSGKEDPSKECVEDEKKDVLMTPAPLGVTSRRRRVKEDSTVQRVYSTRRSARLAEKNLNKLNVVDNEVSSEISTKEPPSKIDFSNAVMNLKEDFGDSDEISGVTGVDTNTNSFQNTEESDFEVVSAQKQCEIDLRKSAEEEKGSHFEADDPEQNINYSNVANGEVSIDFEGATELDEEKWEKSEDPYGQNISAPLNLNIEVEESDKGEAEERADDPEQEMKVRSMKETGIVFDAEAEAEHKVKKIDKTEGPSGENVVMPLNLNDAGKGFDTETEMDGEKNDRTEETSGESIVMSQNLNDEAGNVFDMDAEQDEEQSNKPEDPTGESTVTPLNSNHEVGIGPGTEAELVDERRDKTEELNCESTVMALHLNNEVQQHIVDGMDGLNNTYGKMSNSYAAEYFNNILENEDRLAAVESSFNTETDNEIEKEMYDNSDVNSEGVPYLDAAMEKLMELRLQKDTIEVLTGAGDSDFIDHLDIPAEFNQEEGHDEIGTCKHEESTNTAADLVPEVKEAAAPSVWTCTTQVCAPLGSNHLATSSGMDGELWSLQMPPNSAGSDLELIMAEQPCLTSSKNSSSMASKTANDGIAVFSDNKENIGSGPKLVPMTATAKEATTKKKNANLDGLSVRKLSKMLKEQLTIKNSSKDGHGNHHGSKAPSRAALQVLPEDYESHN